MRGVLDFRRARLLDRDWWLLARWSLDWLEQELYGEVSRLKYDLHLAVLEYALEQKTFDLHWDQAQELQERLVRHKLPWLKIKKGPSRRDIKAMADRWKEVFGDPADPTVAARIGATVAALREGAARGQEVGNAFAR